MTAPRFTPHPGCQKCPLHEAAASPGLPTRPWDNASDYPKKPAALLVIGEAPGGTEDKEGESWVGLAGKRAHLFLELSELHTLADIYLSNACRCRPPQNDTPKRSQITACHDYLIEDLRVLYRLYEGNVTLLCLGSTATHSILKCSLSSSFKAQGQRLILGVNEQKQLEAVRVFSTYHPAYTLRNNSATWAVKDHLELLYRYLTGRQKQATTETPLLMAPKPPDWTPSAPNDVICVDIETYGALKNYNQTVFHPVKMEYVDKVPTAQQIKTVAVSMIGPDGEPWSSVFVWTSGYHRLRFKQFMEWASSNHLALLCQNLLFDVTVLRRQPGLDTLITPDTFRLEDTLLWNFLHSEVRPERSLKSASALFNLASYNNLTTEFSSGGYSSVNDPDLHKYNVLDTVATLHLREYLLSLIAKDYGENSPKLGPVCRQHCSELLWAGVFMSEAGIAYDRGALETLRRTCLTEMERLCKLADWEFGLKLEGQGSQKPLKELFTRCVEEADLLSNPQLELTDKTKEISTKNSNISLIIENLPLDSELRTPITLLSMHRKLQKVVSTYLNNLLDNPAKGLVHPTEQNSNVWLAYPSWYVYPSKYGNDEKEGGTIQGRITCKYPPEQTNPPTIKEKRTTRFPGGLLREYDLSQIELRVGAMLSGDQVMAYEYQQRLDRHALTGALFWSIVEGTNKDDFHKLMKTSPKDYTFYRQAGKTANFLVIYEGKARKLQSVFLSMLGFEAPLHHCQAFITAHDARYTKLRGWQEGLKTFAIQHGYVVLPTGWSHLFWGGKDVVRGLDAPKVCNAPVQTFAAQLMQSSQFLIVDTFRKQQLRSVCELNTYDSILIDSPPEEAEVVDKIVGFGLENPPLLERLAGKIPANVPIEYDCKIVYNGQDT